MRRNKDKTVDMWKREIDGYFAGCEGPRLDKNGSPLTDAEGTPLLTVVRPYTVTGLAYALGLESREALLSVEGKPGALIRRALLKIEEYAEQQLFFKESHAGSKLFLEVNFERWRDSAPACEESAGDIGPWGV